MLYYMTVSVLNETSAAFRVGGPDANTYLQGQFTQDLNRPEGTVCYGLFLNQKGKVVADGHILRFGSDEFLLACFSLSAPRLRERLEAYLIADEVNIKDETEQWARISMWGDGAGAAVEKLIGRKPPNPETWVEGRGGWVFRGRRSAGDSFELLVPRVDCDSVGEDLKVMGAMPADVVVAERERITGGIPWVPVDIGLNDLPNEGGLDAVAISYTKGCYLGQEVMARLKNLGQVRRHLHIVRGMGQPPRAGALLFKNEIKAGEVRSAARDGEGFVAMAMLSLAGLNLAAGLSLNPGGSADITIARRV